MNIGHAIRLLRKQKGYTQEQLADFAYTTKSTISNLESGHQGYSTGLLKHLAQALNCPISKIFLVAEVLAENPEQPPVEKLPIDVLFEELSQESQHIVRLLIQQIIAENKRK